MRRTLVICADIFDSSVTQQSDDDAATTLRLEAIRLYDIASELAPLLAEAHAGAAELRLDMGRRALMNSPAGSAEAVAALELLQRSVQGFRASAQLDPEQRGVYIYNTARAYALLGNNAACMEALAELKAQKEEALLANMAGDSDFDRCRHLLT